MRAAIIQFPGTNREHDMARALTLASGVEPQMIWHGETSLPALDLIVLPGGFSHGDYLRSGAIAARAAIMPEVVRQAEAGVPVLGVCNGFQILTEVGLLPGALMRNAGLTFICRELHLRVETTDCDFTSGYARHQVIRTPVAHHDGNYFAADETLDALEQEDRVAFRYCTPDGTVNDAGNPNGSQRNIAGILNRQRNVLGLMPHPENLIEDALGGTDGLPLFSAFVGKAA
ncbi:MAG: phosphoribosylformylglycinamidine synthase subunit PurQ [Pseudomonadota bacterium]